jgi:FKBP-type peptidyl-prolyl cis-trans isomerase SlyD
MKVEKNKVVTIDYVLKNDAGEILDSSEANGALPYIHGTGSLVPGLERELEGRSPGDAISAVVEPEDGYGEYEADAIFEVPKKNLEGLGEIEEGTSFHAETDEGIQLLTVKEIKATTVLVDANHPLAGETLHFEVKIVDIREASPEELEHGHVHEDDDPHEEN